ncbi:hypothetical protein [Bradyrhizobium sp. SZCCHNR1070]|uniref:hypothetical protein n=1 Tax=Bradyrhizobium sp. SZCCHNR1070 TaxID=3057361 RepID=UPI0029162073|nr:hypothetical protein [Bradyrhizobium sp. SZCCHNR1070]
MSDQDRPKSTIHISNIRQPVPQKTDVKLGSNKTVSRREIRSREELMPLADKIAQDATVVDRFRRVQGSDDEQLASQFIGEIARIAQTLDSNITQTDAARITVLLMEILKVSGERPDGER